MSNTVDFIQDNNKYNKSEFIKKYPLISKKILDKDIEYLSETENIFIFTSKDEDKALDKKNKVIETINKDIKIQNIIGFIGCRNEQLHMYSRFSTKDFPDYFLYYMLNKVFNINLVNLNIDISKSESILNMLVYMFPTYLNNAMRKGLYKLYKPFNHNDANVKGKIDIINHIKNNIPFNGKIAYSNREFSYDNYLTELIRHTIEFIKSSNINGSKILSYNETVKKNTSDIIQVTPKYDIGKRQKIIRLNKSKPVYHAYFLEYRDLQKLCLMILNYEEYSIRDKNDSVFGLLFDVAWLWEEYLNIILLEDFIHAENKKGKNGVCIFEGNKRTVYPDFYSKDRGIVLDAKYKRLEDNSISREDLYQIITYASVLGANKTGLIYPTNKENSKLTEVGITNTSKISVFKQSLNIPKNYSNYEDFVEKIKESEIVVKNSLIDFRKKLISS